ncbi:MAG: PAS domain-containing protein [Deltaproteobacteria bacterium]|nr:PAS domain-containing protein [Deltaproteobacteria bacterium]
MSRIDYRAVFEASVNPYMVVDRELRYVDANPAYLAITGTTREQLIGRGVFEVFPHDPADSTNAPARMLRESLEQVVRTRRQDVIAHIPYRVQRVPGGPLEDRLWSATHTPVLDEHGDVELILQHTQDVTELADTAQAASVLERAFRVQQELVQLEARVDNLRAMFDQAPGFVAFLEAPEHRFVLTNRAYDRLIGGRSVIGKPIREALPELVGQGFLELLDSVFTTGTPFVGHAMKAELTDPVTGVREQMYLDFLYQPILGVDGTTRGILVQGHDITEQQRALMRAHFMMRATEHAAVAVGDLDLALRRIAGAAVEELADWAFIDLYDDNTSRRIAAAHADPAAAEIAAGLMAFPSPSELPPRHPLHALSTGVQLVPELTNEMIDGIARSPEHARLLHAAGFRSLLSVPLWQGGRLFGVIAIGSTTRTFSDEDSETMVELGRIAAIAIDRARLSNERAALLRSELEARQRAEASNNAKDEFLAMLGHELRNPLAPILTAVQLLRLRGETSSAREQAIIERQANHLVRLLDDLLEVSRIARGKIELRKEPLEISVAAAKAVEIASPLIDRKGHQLTIEIPTRGLRVFGDEARISQVIANLLTNAARYTPADGHIWLSATREKGEVVICVRDNGIGIAPEMLPTIFELFVQAPQAPDRAEGGLGLGLTLVRRLVELHGGTATATSGGLGMGTVLTIRIPAVTSELPVAAEPKAQKLMVGLSQRVLLVDDNEDAAMLLGELLRGRGHEVHIAHDGLEAVELAVRLRPDIAVVDIGLPTIDGYEVARRMRQRLGERAPRMIALTGYGAAHDRAKAMAAGFEAHITKPVGSARILELIDTSSAA